MKKKFPYYPIYLDIEDRDVLIIGGGEVCARKAETLMRYGAKITIASTAFTDEIIGWGESGLLQLLKMAYREELLTGRSLVIASTNDRCVNGRVARDCRRRKIPVNVVDVTHLCEFIVPAIVERGAIQIAVSTGGKSPALARILKRDLQRLVGREYSELNEVLGSLRVAAQRALPTDRDRKIFFDGILAEGVLQMLREGKDRQAFAVIADACQRAGVALSHDLLSRLAR